MVTQPIPVGNPGFLEGGGGANSYEEWWGGGRGKLLFDQFFLLLLNIKAWKSYCSQFRDASKEARLYLA